MMNKVRGCAVFAFVMLAQLAAAEPGAAAPADVTRTHLTGDAAFANFDEISSDGCIRTLGSVFVYDFESESTSATDKIVSLSIFRADSCKAEILIEGFGTSTDFEFTSAKNLSSATLIGALNFTNIVDGSVHPVPINVTFTAIAGRTQTAASDGFKQEGIVFSSSTTAAARKATAQGTFIIGADELFEGVPSIEAIIATGLERSTTVATP